MLKAALFAIDQIQEEKKNSDSNYGFWHHYNASGRTLSGQTAEAFWFLFHLNLLSVGFNCALGANN